MKMTEFMILSRRVFLRDNSLCRKTRTILVMALRSDFIVAQLRLSLQNRSRLFTMIQNLRNKPRPDAQGNDTPNAPPSGNILLNGNPTNSIFGMGSRFVVQLKRIARLHW